MSECMTCPFCKDGGFDLIGLRHHLMTGSCEVFDATLTVTQTHELSEHSLEQPSPLQHVPSTASGNTGSPISRRTMMTDPLHIHRTTFRSVDLIQAQPEIHELTQLRAQVEELEAMEDIHEALKDHETIQDLKQQLADTQADNATLRAQVAEITAACAQLSQALQVRDTQYHAVCAQVARLREALVSLAQQIINKEVV